jgi:pimeloyl-CoA synthetase
MPQTMHKSAHLFRIVDLRALDDDGVGGEVDTPRQRGSRHEHLEVPTSKELLHQRAVHSVHTRVVDAEAIRQQVLWPSPTRLPSDQHGRRAP